MTEFAQLTNYQVITHKLHTTIGICANSSEHFGARIAVKKDISNEFRKTYLNEKMSRPLSSKSTIVNLRVSQRIKHLDMTIPTSTLMEKVSRLS